jgi:hypothetical protein
MSDGMAYRLGYLNGRVQAYEGEEVMKQLVMKSKKLKGKSKRKYDAKNENDKFFKMSDGRKVIY